MTRWDRYALGQMAASFGAFALVLAAVYWINRAVALFDRLIADGQSFLVFLEFTALTLPTVIRLIVPFAAFAAALAVANRMIGDREVAVLRATGASSMRLARPALAFGLLTGLGLAGLVHVLEPLARERLALRGAEIAGDAAARLLTEGSFEHPSAGLTFYVGEVAPDGTMRDVFLSDARDADAPTIYTAASALLVRAPEGVQLVMFDGLGQQLRMHGGGGDDVADGLPRLFTTRFEDFAFAIGGAASAANRERDAREYPTPALIASELPRDEILEEVHRRGGESARVLGAAILGFGFMLLGQHRRVRSWWQPAAAVAAVIAMVALENVAGGAMADRPALWSLHYAPWLAAVAAMLSVLAWSDRPRRNAASLPLSTGTPPDAAPGAAT